MVVRMFLYVLILTGETSTIKTREGFAPAAGALVASAGRREKYHCFVLTLNSRDETVEISVAHHNHSSALVAQSSLFQ